MPNFYSTDRVGRLALVLLVIAGIGLGSLGYALNAEAFLPGLVTNLAGDAIVILVGLLLLDRFADYRRDREWEGTRSFLYRAVCARLLHFLKLTEIYLPLRPVRVENRTVEELDYAPSVADAAQFAAMSALLKQASEHGTAGREGVHSVVELYDAAVPEIAHFRGILLPQLHHSSSDPSLIEDMHVLDEAFLKFESIAEYCRVNQQLGQHPGQHPDEKAAVARLLELDERLGYSSLSIILSQAGGVHHKLAERVGASPR